MSKLTTIFNAINTEVSTVLSNHTEIPVPYVFDDNAEPFLRQGYRLFFTEGQEKDREICNRVYLEQGLGLVITREITAHNTKVDALKSIELSLMEDWVLISRKIRGNPTIDESINTYHSSTNGITYLETDRKKYYQLEAAISFEFFETTT